jgi:hypothetical protein
MAYETFDNLPEEGGVGLSLQSGSTAETIIQKTIKLLDGANFNITEVVDKRYDRKIDGEPFVRDASMLASHSEGSIDNILMAPGNYIEELIRCYLGNDYVSTQLYTIDVESDGGATFSMGDIIYGNTSEARAKVVKVVGDTLWICEKWGTFQNSEDLYDKPGGTDYGKNTAADVNQTTVTSCYVHWNQAVVYFSNASTVAASKTASYAFVSDLMEDFRRAQVTSGNRRCRVELVDGSATPIRLSGYIGAACQCVPFDGGTTEFTAGKTLTAGGSIVGEIIYVDLVTGTWVGEDAAGYLWVIPDSTTPISVSDDDALAESVAGGVAAANCPTTAANPYNAAYVYNDVDGSTQSWNGDVSSADTTTTMTYEVVQRLFYADALTMFAKYGDGDTVAMAGAKITELALPFNNNDDPVLSVSLEGISHAKCTVEPTFPDIVTLKHEWGLGVSNRAVYLDGSAPTDFTVLEGDISLSRTYDAERKRSYTSLTPTELMEMEPEIAGKAVVTFESDEFRQKAWRGTDSATGPEAGAFQTLRMLFDLKSESLIAGTTYYEAIFGCFGIIEPEEAPDKAKEGYTLPVSLMGTMLDSTYKWGPFEVVFIDGETSH